MGTRLVRDCRSRDAGMFGRRDFNVCVYVAEFGRIGACRRLQQRQKR